ncbi:ORF6N domain-containing protein [Bacillus infantis]|nr:ORF6N domain-containing protein [Bacillus infantis]
MADYVRVNETDLIVTELKGERVVTFSDIDKLHKRPSGTARKRFNDNKARFIEGVDFHLIKSSQKSEFRTLEIPNRGLILLTESGYLLLSKSFTDDLAWTVQRQLVNTYFKMKQLSQQNEIQPIPTGQIQSLDIMEMMIKEMKKDRERVDQIEQKLNKIVNILSN